MIPPSPGQHFVINTIQELQHMIEEWKKWVQCLTF